MACQINANVLELFVCPICWEHIIPPIFQCPNGHIICNICYYKVKLCPTCRISLKNGSRCRNMEMVASNLLYPCCFTIEGCNKKLSFQELRNHEKCCEYSENYNCKLIKDNVTCSWSGRPFHFETHLKDKHMDSIIYPEAATFEAFVNIKNQVICFDTLLFLVSIETEHNLGNTYTYTFHIGQISAAERGEIYCYRLLNVPSMAHFEGLITRFTVDITQLARTGECLHFKNDCEILSLEINIVKLCP